MQGRSSEGGAVRKHDRMTDGHNEAPDAFGEPRGFIFLATADARHDEAAAKVYDTEVSAVDS